MKLVPSTYAGLWVAAPTVGSISKEVKPYLGDMRRLLAKHKGYGLSAPQVGVSSRFFITVIDGAKVCVNPRVVSQSQEGVSMSEGCLTFPNQFISVYRPRSILFEWTDLKGNTHVRAFFDVEARIMLHELDHLNGICILPASTL